MLSIIIISYNSHCTISQCLAPLLESNRWPAIIIDNASTDGSADTLTKHFPQCDVVALAQNNGYGRAANIGLKKANTPFAMLLNPDLYATPIDIEKLLAHARQNKEKAAILAPAVSAKDFTGGPPQPVQWISGSAMLFNMSLMGKIGFFDEKIFLFSEETDICRRTVMAGYDILLCHDVYMEHLKGQSSGTNPEIEYMKNWHFGWSNVYYCTKHGIAKGKQSPARLARQYRLKACFATNPTKRAKYRGRADGVRAFMAGEKAFFPDGMPKASPR